MDWRPLSISVLLAGCSDPSASDDAVPGTLIVDQLERQLAGQPCIGAIDRWERHYFYGLGAAPPAIDRHVVLFRFLEAGVDGHIAQRRFERLQDQSIYDGLGRVAFGTINVDTGASTVEDCGPSQSPTSVQSAAG